MDAELERRLARRAASQSGLITRSQLTSIGLRVGQIDGCVKRGRLTVIYSGVYLASGAPVDDEVRLRAATLTTEGFASHRSAGFLLGLNDSAPSRPEVVITST